MRGGERAEERVLGDVVAPIRQVQPAHVGHHPAAAARALAGPVEDHGLLVVGVGVPFGQDGECMIILLLRKNADYQPHC